MADYKIVFTNNALARMKVYHLSEEHVLDAFNYGETEVAGKGGRWNAVRKYHGYEVGVNYDQDKSGKWTIVSVWKRARS